MSRRALALGALVFSGAVQALISAPHSWIALHPIAWVPALAVIARLSGRRAFLAGWLVGAAANAAIFAWLVHTIATFTELGAVVGVAALLLFAALHGLYAGVFASGFGPIRRVAGGAWPIAIAAWFTACEFLAPQFFPYQQGVAWYVAPRIFLAAATTGVAGISFLVLFANALVLQSLERASARALAANGAAFAAVLALALGAAARQDARVGAAEAAATRLRMALVQPGDDPTEAPARNAREARAHADALARQARDALAADHAIQVVVLPEKALEFEPSRSWNRSVRELAPAFGVEIWTGGAASERGESGSRYFNSAFRLTPDGADWPRYDKNVLVPFGEWMPDSFAWVSRALGRNSFVPGAGMPLYDAPGVRFAFLICYEAILSDYVREPVRAGANLLVNLTYDGWFGDTAEPAQHLMLVAVQAAQLGVPIARATTTGLSAFVDARGRVTAQTLLLQQHTLVADVAPVRVSGSYVAWGDWFAWLCAAASGLLLAIAWRRRSP
jgi:apolipoprotein N-acyltransferase